jgi:hypothetical protein
MGKILVVFRGENKRFNDGIWYDVRACIPNNKRRIIESLKQMNHDVHVYLATYRSEFLQCYIEEYNAEKIFLMDYDKSSQHLNFKFVLESIAPFANDFDKIIILRFDLLFKKDISTWPMWDKEGIMFPWKDVSLELYNLRKYCQEVIISIDSKYLNEFKDLYIEKFEHWKDITWGLHFLTVLLEEYKKIPFFFMEGDTCWESNTSTNGADFNKKNPYLINSIYMYGHDDLHLILV